MEKGVTLGEGRGTGLDPKVPIHRDHPTPFNFLSPHQSSLHFSCCTLLTCLPGGLKPERGTGSLWIPEFGLMQKRPLGEPCPGSQYHSLGAIPRSHPFCFLMWLLNWFHYLFLPHFRKVIDVYIKLVSGAQHNNSGLVYIAK